VQRQPQSFVILQQLLRRLQSQSLRDLGTEAYVEVGFVDPHSMQDACELARDCDDRAQHARPFGDPQAPRPQCRPFPDPQQKACGRFTQRLPNRNVTLLANTAFIGDLRSRLVSPRRQAKMRSNRSRSRKASGISYSHLERKGGDTDTRQRHQAAANRIMRNHPKPGDRRPKFERRLTAWNGGSQPHLASGLKRPTIHISSWFIPGIPVHRSNLFTFISQRE
jgi:hypothetical protein